MNRTRLYPIAAGDNVMINDWQGGPDKGQGLSFLTGQWTWPIKREFIWPYNKRTYVTNSTSLNRSGWCVRHEQICCEC
jgi:hypothetical protein